MARATRTTVDLTGYPDLIAIYLGMKVLSLRGFFTLLGFGPKINASVAARPDGLLRHENFLMSLWPPHAGMRQYWRDFDALEKWTRSLPHQGVVGGFPERSQRRHVLARDILHARRRRSHFR
jgi:hypothetical protein